MMNLKLVGSNCIMWTNNCGMILTVYDGKDIAQVVLKKLITILNFWLTVKELKFEFWDILWLHRYS